ncbi:MAG: hypothetical protein QXS81_03180 [Candidatus Micrarchaeaceae archaeon]
MEANLGNFNLKQEVFYDCNGIRLIKNSINDVKQLSFSVEFYKKSAAETLHGSAEILLNSAEQSRALFLNIDRGNISNIVEKGLNILNAGDVLEFKDSFIPDYDDYNSGYAGISVIMRHLKDHDIVEFTIDLNVNKNIKIIIKDKAANSKVLFELNEDGKAITTVSQEKIKEELASAKEFLRRNSFGRLRNDELT